MNDLKVFENSEFGKLEVMMIDSKEYFPATRCAKILGYSNPQQAIRLHCKGVREISTPLANGGNQKVNYISEGDLYRLIIRSKLPSAEKFERWVFDEVLPSIRKNGLYGEINIEELITKTATVVAIEVAKQMIATQSNISLIDKSKPMKKAKAYKYVSPSKISTLPPDIKERVDEMIVSGNYSCQNIANFIINSTGMYISQMAVNRYKRNNFVLN